MNCMLMRRKEFSNITDVLSLFKKATVTNIDGVDGSTSKILMVNKNVVPAGVTYGFGWYSFYAMGYGLTKINSGIVSSTPILISDANYYAELFNTTQNSTDVIVLRQHGTTNPSSQYAGNLTVFQFNAPTDVVDSILGSCTVTGLYYKAQSTAGTASTSDTSHKVVIAALGANLTLWEYKNGWNPFYTAGTQVGTASGTTLSFSHNRNGLILGLD